MLTGMTREFRAFLVGCVLSAFVAARAEGGFHRVWVRDAAPGRADGYNGPGRNRTEKGQLNRFVPDFLLGDTQSDENYKKEHSHETV